LRNVQVNSSRARSRLPNGASRFFGEQAGDAFDGGTLSSVAPPVHLKVLHAKRGQQALQLDFLVGMLNPAGMLSDAK